MAVLRRFAPRWTLKSAFQTRKPGFWILLPLPCLTVKIDPEDENSSLVSQSARKTEISRDFSAFFAPNFFRISIDPFSIFLRGEGFELPKTHFFQNFITNESNTKDLNPRQGFKFFRYFALDTNCLQIVPSKTDPSLLREDPNPRNAKKRFFLK